MAWTWAAASCRGTAHAQAGEGRQDAYRVVPAEPCFLVAIACDGAGSTTHGGAGAAIAARVLSSRAKAWIATTGTIPTPEAVALWVTEARALIATAAARRNLVAGDFATTIVMAISDGASTLTAQIGDGAIVARCAGTDELVALSWPESGDYAATTFFLTDGVPRLRIGLLDALLIDRLGLLTDGLERLALDFVGSTPHRLFFDAMFAAVASGQGAGRDALLSPQLSAFLDSDRVIARTDDDKTLILAAFA